MFKVYLVRRDNQVAVTTVGSLKTAIAVVYWTPGGMDNDKVIAYRIENSAGEIVKSGRKDA